ncbi:hypothetical protein CH302_07415 [Rhodococcus sp. 15-2388-1-1a]|uniref:hypothetical protein n=1 Tax=Nocardiaceae TaxID=85025 RepID=UPI00055DA11F|nr:MULTISPECIES: hypothetical protein [Rhodococcus]OZF02135.1 hypothetical protein CH302_07415 [Rhodococcus sp. 15-2388-1-1a]
MNWSLLLSGLALCVSLGTVIYVQMRTDRRELIRWQRDTLTKALTPVIEELENIRVGSIDPNQTNEQLHEKIMAMRHHSNIFFLLGFDNFSNDYIKILNSLDGQIRMYRMAPNVGIHLSAFAIPELTARMLNLARDEIELKRFTRLRRAKAKLDSLRSFSIRKNKTDNQ